MVNDPQFSDLPSFLVVKNPYDLKSQIRFWILQKKCSLTELTPAPNADEFNKRGVCFIEWKVFVTFIREQSSHEKSCSRKRLFQANAKSYSSRKQFIEGKKWHCSTVAWAGRGRGAWAPWAPPIILTGTFNLVSCHALHDHSALRFNVFISVR